MDVVLIANPKAGSCEPDQIRSRLQHHGCQVRDFAFEDLDQLSEVEADRIVIAGGDGSIAPIVAEATKTTMPVALIPAGTANDFARAASLPLDVEEACRLAATGNRTAPRDLGWIDDRPFVNAASVGLGVRAAREAHGFKRFIGPGAYLVGAIKAAITAPPTRLRLEITGRDAFEGYVWQLIVGVSGAFGWGSKIEAESGSLDVVIVPATSRWRLPHRAVGMRTGNLNNQPGVRHLHADECMLHGPRRLNIDGDVIAAGPHTRCRLDAASWRLVVPDIIEGDGER